MNDPIVVRSEGPTLMTVREVSRLCPAGDNLPHRFVADEWETSAREDNEDYEGAYHDFREGMVTRYRCSACLLHLDLMEAVDFEVAMGASTEPVFEPYPEPAQ